MLRNAFTALACLLSAIGLPAAANATVFGFGFLIEFGNGDGAIGLGRLFTTDNGDNTFTITGASGAASYISFSTGDVYAGATIRNAAASLFAPDGSVPTITYTGGAYAFDNLALSGDGRFYDFFHDENGDLIGGSGEVGGPAQFQFGILEGAVPETATWAMMIVGFGAVGASLRRRRTSVTFA
jgi:hypothetical protein